MLPSDPSRPSYKLYKDCPVCFANAVNLAEEIAAYGEFRPETVDAVIRFERDCPRFYAVAARFLAKGTLRNDPNGRNASMARAAAGI